MESAALLVERCCAVIDGWREFLFFYFFCSRAKWFAYSPLLLTATISQRVNVDPFLSPFSIRAVPPSTLVDPSEIYSQRRAKAAAASNFPFRSRLESFGALKETSQGKHADRLSTLRSQTNLHTVPHLNYTFFFFNC